MRNALMATSALIAPSVADVHGPPKDKRTLYTEPDTGFGVGKFAPPDGLLAAILLARGLGQVRTVPRLLN